MNTLGKSPVAENGRVPNDRVIILDAGAQYGKVSESSLTTTNDAKALILPPGHRQESS